MPLLYVLRERCTIAVDRTSRNTFASFVRDYLSFNGVRLDMGHARDAFIRILRGTRAGVGWEMGKAAGTVQYLGEMVKRKKLQESSSLSLWGSVFNNLLTSGLKISGQPKPIIREPCYRRQYTVDRCLSQSSQPPGVGIERPIDASYSRWRSPRPRRDWRDMSHSPCG